MGENSGIEWTDHTFNPWIGCTKVSPGCDHCYAEKLAARFKLADWGTGNPRRLAHDDYWKQPLAWNRKARKAGVRKRVFCASLADVFDNEVPEEWRVRLFGLIEQTPYLDWLLLTKRIGNARNMMPVTPLHNVWLGISVVNQEEADRDIPKLLRTPARLRFLSMEPLLGPVKLPGLQCEGCGYTEADKRFQLDHHLCKNPTPTLDWVIVGGESGTQARPMHPIWVRSLRDQCLAAGVPFFFKQWGAWKDGSDFATDAKAVLTDGTICEPTPDALRALDGQAPVPPRQPTMMRRVGKKASGRDLDGREWNELPIAA